MIRIKLKVKRDGNATWSLTLTIKYASPGAAGKKKKKKCLNDMPSTF